MISGRGKKGGFQCITTNSYGYLQEYLSETSQIKNRKSSIKLRTREWCDNYPDQNPPVVNINHLQLMSRPVIPRSNPNIINHRRPEHHHVFRTRTRSRLDQGITSFHQLLDSYKEPPDANVKLSDSYGRLKVWAENSPLTAVELLTDLKTVLEEVGEIKESESDGKVVNIESDQSLALDPEMEAEISSTTPLKEAIKETGNVITCLYRLSITIQNPASQNRLEMMEKIDTGYYERFDIHHVDNKYRLGIGPEYQYLIERLGKVNIKRRQILKYSEEHHERTVGRRDAVGLVGEGAELNEDDFFSEGPSAVQTDISTVNEVNAEFVAEGLMDSKEIVADPIGVDSYSEPDFRKHPMHLPRMAIP
ncbi:hypothetical protein FPQ18DRAFT_304926 [Pyronema domesticum]|nr:hypothetical protein FPQ18DRAFT_304926 [Pyronema domesticum]